MTQSEQIIELCGELQYYIKLNEELESLVLELEDELDKAKAQKPEVAEVKPQKPKERGMGTSDIYS